MIIKNTTIQNKTKQNKLSTEHIIPTQCITNSGVSEFLKSLKQYKASKQSILFSIGCELVKNNANPHLEFFLSEHSYSKIKINNIPQNEFDLLGSAYQYLNSKKENLERGSFYTGYKIAKDFVNDLDFTKNQTILDPSCGSGTFLFNSNASPDQIFGVDNDPVAVMIAKFNYFIKFPNAKYPNIFCDDFFIWHSNNKQIKFGESFSYFIEIGYTLLKNNGILRYLLPESILNVKKHSDVRKFILDNTNLRKIKKYKGKFSGVMSEVYMLEIDNNKNSHDLIFEDSEIIKIPKTIFKNLKNNIFAYLNKQDISIIEKVKSLYFHNLSNSIFALGVVSGGNGEKLFDYPIENSEPIYTGKDVIKYKLLPPTKHIIFDRSKLQQVASDTIYRAPYKLIYKTINKHIKVAIDTTGSLTTNSANIIIPNIIGFDIYTIMGFLNSQLYSFLNIKLFGGVNKIAKENLQALPFPKISNEENLYIKKLVIQTMQTEDDTELQKYINSIFGLTFDEIQYINNF